MHATDAVVSTASLPSSTSSVRVSRKPNSVARLLCTVFVSWWIIQDQLALGFTDPPELTTIEDLSGRGTKKFGDHCVEDRECGFAGSYCEPKKSKCACKEEFEATNHIDKCGQPANVNESCFFNEQCEAKVSQTECRDGRCICIFEKIPVTQPDGLTVCVAEQKEEPNLQYVDPTMIGVLVGMALMFIIICVVLRLFSKARWNENRTIFNTPNARLMNVSLLRENKLLHPQERRGSRASVRVPSRQPSMASLRPHSPNASQGSRTGSRRGSRGSSGNTSSVSTKSNKSPPYQPNAMTETVLDHVSVEIFEAKA
ncbi:EB domain-containing julius seizure protein isoform X2 [Colletes latitarsis]|uniref:EB domain-containing julius seizure protein isoform X2 n=1 Tax=Colletes latitarsis TaxID=2605962 RepID=UPI0040359E29